MTCELNAEKLLSMSEKQLADFTTQQLREKHSNDAEQGAILRTSTQEVLEARHRNTMAGNSESWRGGQGSGSVTAQETEDAIINHASEQNGKKRRLEENEQGLSSAGQMEVFLASEIGRQQSQSRPSEIEKRVIDELKASSGKSSNKRPIDVDAGSRFVSSPKAAAPVSERPAKVKKLEGSSQEKEGPSSPVPTPSPRNKAPSVLTLLKATETSLLTADNSGPVPVPVPAAVDAEEEKSSSIMSEQPSSLSAVRNAIDSGDLVRLENSTGGQSFAVTRPGGIIIDCSIYSSSRFAIIPSSCLPPLIILNHPL